MMLKCLIVDDEYPAQALLEQYVLNIPSLQLVAKCLHATEALAIMNGQQVDILLLDIQMPDLTGLDLLRTLIHKPQVVLTTAYAHHAVDGFELSVTDYLLKPFSLERFAQAIKKCTEQIQLRQAGISATTTEAITHLIVRADHKTMKVPVDDILYIEGLREYVSIYTFDKRIITLESMKNMETLLPKGQFMRVHKSYIVSLNKIDALAGHILELKGKQIPIGRMYQQLIEGYFVR